MTGEASFLESAEAVLEDRGPELRQNVMRPNSHLIDFINNRETTTEEMAENTLQDIQVDDSRDGQVCIPTLTLVYRHCGPALPRP